MAGQGAKFVEGNLFRHVSVMALTSSVGLMAIFVVDLINIIYISWLQDAESTAAIGYAGAILFFTTAFGIGLSSVDVEAACAHVGDGRVAVHCDGGQPRAMPVVGEVRDAVGLRTSRQPFATHPQFTHGYIFRSMNASIFAQKSRISSSV